MDAFACAREVYGFDINSQYVETLRETSAQRKGHACRIECRNFFDVAWVAFAGRLKGRILVIGNPPWVTNSALGSIGGGNLPKKANFQGHNGLAAKTGKANFDISEWMMIKLTEALSQRPACLAMLCKMSTARKTLRHAWLNRLNIGRCSLHAIDAMKHFGASVDACLLILHTEVTEVTSAASVYSDLSFCNKIATLGLVGNELAADIDEYARLRDLDGVTCYRWRSGVKHDASSVMEFTLHGQQYLNGMREICDLESRFMFPLLKSSDIANGRLTPKRCVLLTQRKPCNDTGIIESIAPKTWQYLLRHSAALDKRKSIIYDKRSRFAVFGVGNYTFSPWKVAISGLYKSCRFEIVGQYRGKPIVMDDTCYFISCASEHEARFACELLNSDICQRFLRSLVFFDAKRPINVDILNRIDLHRIANRLNRQQEARECLGMAAEPEDRQLERAFEKSDAVD